MNLKAHPYERKNGFKSDVCICGQPMSVHFGHTVESGKKSPWFLNVYSWKFPALIIEGKRYTLGKERKIIETTYMIFSSFEDISDKEKEYVINRFFQMEKELNKIKETISELDLFRV